MKRSMKSFALLLIALIAGTEAFAQIPSPRKDDHFHRRLIVNRIDLNEKMNAPIVSALDPALYGRGGFQETSGIIQAVFNGLQSGKYLAYHPDSLNKSLTWEEVEAKVRNLTTIEEPDWDEDEDCDWCGDEDEEEWIVDESLVDGEGDSEGFLLDGSESMGTDASSEDLELSAFESSIEFIENRIFDKNSSTLIHDIEYIRIVWVDPGETLPDQNVICLKYSDLRETLENCQWTNAHNDAEHRNLLEVFDQRMFNSFVTYVSGSSVRTLPESDYRSNQLVAFEHDLWSY